MDRSTIKYRDFENRDFPVILDIVIETWKFNKWVPDKAAKVMGAYYLSEILAESCKIWIAEDNGVPVGIAAVKNNRKPALRWRYRWREWVSSFILLFGKGQFEFLQFVKTEALDRELLAKSHMHFDAELTFLLTRSSYKGHGIGDALYALFLDYLAENKLNSFCLFTDSSCNVGFYEHKGLYRLAEKAFYWKDKVEDGIKSFPEDYYLYGNRLSGV